MSIRAHINRTNVIRSIAVASVAGLGAFLPASGAFASTASSAAPQVHGTPNGLAPLVECLNWSATLQSFPKLSKTSQSVTVVVNGLGSNCESEGTSYIYDASFFGDLTGTATNKAVSLSGNLAITWPADSGYDPTIASVQVSGPKTGVSLSGTGTAGLGTGEAVEGSYAVTGTTSTTTSTTQTATGTSPFGVFINEG